MNTIITDLFAWLDRVWPQEKASMEQTFDNFFNQTDTDAIRSDWQAVGDDLRKVISEFESSFIGENKND